MLDKHTHTNHDSKELTRHRLAEVTSAHVLSVPLSAETMWNIQVISHQGNPVFVVFMRHSAAFVGIKGALPLMLNPDFPLLDLQLQCSYLAF